MNSYDVLRYKGKGVFCFIIAYFNFYHLWLMDNNIWHN